MNIFVLDKDPYKIVSHYCDLHVNKMILEYAQMLAAPMHILGSDSPELPKLTHKNHPCTKWVMGSRANYTWLVELFKDCLQEFSSRRRKAHAYTRLLPIYTEFSETSSLPDGELLPWPQVVRDEDKVVGDDFDSAVKAYRKYYAFKLRDFRERKIYKKTPRNVE